MLGRHGAAGCTLEKPKQYCPANKFISLQKLLTTTPLGAGRHTAWEVGRVVSVPDGMRELGASWFWVVLLVEEPRQPLPPCVRDGALVIELRLRHGGVRITILGNVLEVFRTAADVAGKESGRTRSTKLSFREEATSGSERLAAELPLLDGEEVVNVGDPPVVDNGENRLLDTFGEGLK